VWEDYLTYGEYTNLIEDRGQQPVTQNMEHMEQEKVVVFVKMSIGGNKREKAAKPENSCSLEDNNREIGEVRCRDWKIDSGTNQWDTKRDPGLDDDRGC
jgi:hypothetical protein